MCVSWTDCPIELDPSNWTGWVQLNWQIPQVSWLHKIPGAAASYWSNLHFFVVPRESKYDAAACGILCNHETCGICQLRLATSNIYVSSFLGTHLSVPRRPDQKERPDHSGMKRHAFIFQPQFDSWISAMWLFFHFQMIRDWQCSGVNNIPVFISFKPFYVKQSTTLLSGSVSDHPKWK